MKKIAFIILAMLLPILANGATTKFQVNGISYETLEEDNQAVNTPCTQRLGHTELLLLDMNLVAGILVVDKQLVIDKHGDDSCHRTQDSRSLGPQEVCAAELYDDREAAYEQGQRDVFDNLGAVGHHQDEERGDEEHQREL